MADLKKIAWTIFDRGYKRNKIAEVLGISYNALFNKLNGKSEFTVGEANKLSDFLGLTLEEREQLFFAQKVEENGNEGR